MVENRRGRKDETEVIEVSSDDFRQQLTELVNQAAYKGVRVIVKRYGKPYAALVGPVDLAKLEGAA